MPRFPNCLLLAPALVAGLAACLTLTASPAAGDVLELDATGAVSRLAVDRTLSVVPAPANEAAPPLLRASLEDSARRHALSPVLLEALVWQESRWRSSALSGKGAIGLAQLMPETARELGVDVRDPAANLEGGARYLRRQLDRFNDLPSALAAYNAGPARVAAAGGVPAIAETRDFVNAILGRMARATP